MKDISGKRFGKLVAIRPHHKDSRGEYFWLCKCDCGNETIVSGYKLRSGNTKSCGCLQNEMRGQSRTKHHMTNTRLYATWENMRARCKNPNCDSFYRYGARGITVCDEWDHSFENFYIWAMSNGYSDELTIERIDINKGYCPENCCWILPKKQYLNRSDNHRITAFGKTQTIKEWSDESGIKYDTIERRINAYGWTAENAVSIQPGRRWCRWPLILGLDYPYWYRWRERISWRDTEYHPAAENVEFWNEGDSICVR